MTAVLMCIVLYVAESVGQASVRDVRSHQASRLANVNGRRFTSTHIQLDDDLVHLQLQTTTARRGAPRRISLILLKYQPCGRLNRCSPHTPRQDSTMRRRRKMKFEGLLSPEGSRGRAPVEASGEPPDVRNNSRQKTRLKSRPS